MKTIAWLAGIGTLLAAAAYMVVSLNRWEWNRALFFGLIVLIAEVGLATGLVLRKLSHLERARQRDLEVLGILRETQPAPPDRFAWLKDSATGQLNVFITFLVGGGVILSAIAWVDRPPRGHDGVARRERAARRGARADQLPTRWPAARRRDRPRAGRPRGRRPPDQQAPSTRRTRVKIAAGRIALGALGLAVGIAAVLALREATLSTHQHVEPDSRTEVVVSARTVHGERGQTLADMVEALVLGCRLEVSSELAEPIDALGDGRYRAVLTPELDQTNRRQFRGCVEDWTIDQILADVERLESVT